MIEVVTECKLTGLRSSLIFMCENRFKEAIKINAFDHVKIVEIITKEKEQEIFDQFNELIK